jgi:hypothetical protein
MIEFLLVCVLVILFYISLQIEDFKETNIRDLTGTDSWVWLFWKVIGCSILIFGVLKLIVWVLPL